MPGIVGKLWEIVGRLLRGRVWERPCQLPLIREIVGRLKNYEINCGKIVGKPGRDILFFLVFFLVVWGCRAARFGFVADAAAEISIYPRLPVRRPVHTNKQIYIYIYRYFFFYAAVSG